MKMARARASVLALAALACVACAARTEPEDDERYSVHYPLAVEPFAEHVHPLLARRCGSLDCHGSGDRALRIYSLSGARLGGARVGREPTSKEEISVSLATIVSIAPALVFDKAMGRAGHEGGALVFAFDPAETCLSEWLGVAVHHEGPRPAGSAPPFEEACREALEMP